MLGPARFHHIETCATEVCQNFKRIDEIQQCVSTLKNLDAVLLGLRTEYNLLTQSTISPEKSKNTSSKDYSHLDLEKGRRLVKARESAIKSVKLLLAKRRAETSP